MAGGATAAGGGITNGAGAVVIAAQAVMQSTPIRSSSGIGAFR